MSYNISAGLMFFFYIKKQKFKVFHKKNIFGQTVIFFLKVTVPLLSH